MNLGDIGRWLNEMRMVVPDLRLEIAPYNDGGVLLLLRWRCDEKALSYQHAIGAADLHAAGDNALQKLFALMRSLIEESLKPNV